MKTYKNHAIRAYSNECGSFTVDIQNESGEFVWGFEFVGYQQGMEKAVEFINKWSN